MRPLADVACAFSHLPRTTLYTSRDSNRCLMSLRAPNCFSPGRLGGTRSPHGTGRGRVLFRSTLLYTPSTKTRREVPPAGKEMQLELRQGRGMGSLDVRLHKAPSGERETLPGSMKTDPYRKLDRRNRDTQHSHPTPPRTSTALPQPAHAYMPNPRTQYRTNHTSPPSHPEPRTIPYLG